MRITVISVNQEEVALVRGTSAFGRRGTFGCPLVVGDAVFIPSGGREDNLRAGSSISVETGYEDVSEFAVVEEAAESMLRLDMPGDYLITGRVVHVAPQGVVRISVRGLHFEIERDELRGVSPEVGQHVSFKLHGLSLWDTGE